MNKLTMALLFNAALVPISHASIINTTLNFDQTSNFSATQYTEQGFVFETLGNHSFTTLSASNGLGWQNRNNANTPSFNTARITRSDGGLFSILGVDTTFGLTGGSNSHGHFHTIVNDLFDTSSGGSGYTYTFAYNNGTDSCAPTNLCNATGTDLLDITEMYFTWNGHNTSTTSWAGGYISNLDVSYKVEVPEPSSFALLGLGLAGLGLSRKKKTS